MGAEIIRAVQPPLTPLCALARCHGTDKSGHHEYTPIYHALFDDPLKVKRVLEIGIGYPCHGTGNSLRMWRDFFPNADIVGLDSNAEVLVNEGRIRSFVADQSDPTSLRAAMDRVGDVCDMIIDDGSHITAHQIVSMHTLLPYLTPKGVYVVEDLEHDCCPQEVGNYIPTGYTWIAHHVPGPVGCGCGCGEDERLLVIRAKS